MKKCDFFIKCINRCMFVGLLLTVVSSCKKDEIIVPSTALSSIIDFEELSLKDDSYIDSALTGAFISKDVTFHNEKGKWSWDGFALSTMRDTQTVGYSNQFSSFAGSGSSLSRTYLVGYAGAARFKLPVGKTAVLSMEITNTSYSALSMLKGDNISKKFSEKGKDFFRVWMVGYKVGIAKDSVSYLLSDFIDVNASKHYVQKEWKKILTPKLSAIDEVRFRLESSDNHPSFGMNTPAYFALDNVVIQ